MVEEFYERVFYISYKFVKREILITIKFRIVFDVLVKLSEESFLLNECLEIGFFL